MRKAQAVAVTGMGAVSAMGWSLEALWQGLSQGKSGLGPLTLFPSPRHSHLPVGQAPPNDEANERPPASRSILLADCATRQAIQQANLDADRQSAARTGLALGACTGGMLETEAYMQGLIERDEGRFDLAANHVCAAVTEYLARTFHVGGPIATVSDACASGASAITMACDWINAGLADRVVCGGVDVLTRLTLNGFASLLVVAEDGCRPFDAQRQGMSLGEGAGILVLERMDHATARNAAVFGRIAGWATTCDAHHPSGPHPQGDGAFTAMQQALQRADVAPDQVDYINPHGSGTRDNDLAEARAMRRLFGDQPPPFSSTKRSLGHTLAAAGSLEAIVCLLAMQHNVMPANVGFEQVDPEIGWSPLTTPTTGALHTCLSNSLGFGGVNASLVLTCNKEADDA